MKIFLNCKEFTDLRFLDIYQNITKLISLLAETYHGVVGTYGCIEARRVVSSVPCQVYWRACCHQVLGQRTAYSVPCALYSERCTVYTIHCTIFSVYLSRVYCICITQLEIQWIMDDG